MRSWKSVTIVVLAIAGALALTGVFVLGGIMDAALLILIIAVFVAMYRLRRYARAELIYNRLGDPEPPTESRAIGKRVYSTGTAHGSELVRGKVVPPVAGSANLRPVRVLSPDDASDRSLVSFCRPTGKR